MSDPIEQGIFDDLSNLEQTLVADVSGDRARAMIAYFGNVAQETGAMLQSVQVEAERRLVSDLLAAFSASQRVIRSVWESLHGSALPV